MRKLFQVFMVLFFAAGLASCADIKSDPNTLPQDLVNRATDTVKRFKVLPELKSFSKYINDARAVVVLPSVIKAGFIGAAEVGHGMLMVKNTDGSWSYPAFYTLMAGSVGFQIGIQDMEVILIIRNEKALNAVLDYQATLGADAGITLGIFGAGVEGATTTNMDADVLVFAHSKLGLFAGISFDGSILSARRDFNEAYYASGATPRTIVLKRNYSNANANVLRAALDK